MKKFNRLFFATITMLFMQQSALLTIDPWDDEKKPLDQRLLAAFAEFGDPAINSFSDLRKKLSSYHTDKLSVDKKTMYEQFDQTYSSYPGIDFFRDSGIKQDIERHFGTTSAEETKYSPDLFDQMIIRPDLKAKLTALTQEKMQGLKTIIENFILVMQKFKLLEQAATEKAQKIGNAFSFIKENKDKFEIFLKNRKSSTPASRSQDWLHSNNDMLLRVFAHFIKDPAYESDRTGDGFYRFIIEQNLRDINKAILNEPQSFKDALKNEISNLFNKLSQERQERKAREEQERKQREQEEKLRKEREEQERKAREEQESLRTPESFVKDHPELIKAFEDHFKNLPAQETRFSHDLFDEMIKKTNLESSFKALTIAQRTQVRGIIRKLIEDMQEQKYKQERKAREEQERKAREEQERKQREQEEKLRREREEQERKAREEQERKAREEQERKAREEQERKQREQEEKLRKEREEQERKEREEQERKEREEQERKAREEQERKAREEQERKQRDANNRESLIKALQLATCIRK